MEIRNALAVCFGFFNEIYMYVDFSRRCCRLDYIAYAITDVTYIEMRQIHTATVF